MCGPKRNVLFLAPCRKPPAPYGVGLRGGSMREGAQSEKRSNFPSRTTAAEFLRVLTEVNSPYLVPPLDTGNFVDGWPSIEKTLGQAAHVHAKFWKVGPDGSDETLDYPRIVSGLRAAGYDGWVSLEYETPEPEATGVPRALAFLKRMLAGG